jgi:outer membrane protein assembly factor BamB
LKLKAKIFFIIPFIFISGCTGVHLNQQIISDPMDWTMCGGVPEQHNVSKTVMEPPLELIWSYNIDAGLGYSVISVSDGIAFVNDLQGEMYSLDISSGGKIGQINFLGKDANTTPLIDGNDVYVTFAGENNYSVLCYSLLNGNIKWKRNVGYIQTSPILKNDYFYTGALNGRFYKFSKTGRIEWRYKAGSPIHSTCAISGDKAVFGDDEGYVHCVGIEDGLSLWKFKTGESVVTTPMIYNEKVFLGSYDSNYYCLDLNTGTKLWSRNMETKLFTGATLFNDSTVIFGGIDGNLYCLNTADGSLKWKFHTGGVITSTPLTSGKYVYFTSYDRNVYCVDGTNGKSLWNYEMEGKGKTSPVIWRDMLFTANDVEVLCFKHGQNAQK